ncbi:xylose isomerase-like protein [Crassisporium funariophilum]|nr:xylose isomerase-like protein [Crassisporium funariophilum]
MFGLSSRHHRSRLFALFRSTGPPSLYSPAYIIMARTRRASALAADSDDLVSSGPPLKKIKLVQEESSTLTSASTVEIGTGTSSRTRGRRIRKTKELQEIVQTTSVSVLVREAESSSTKRKRKTKAKDVPDKSTFLERVESPWKIGAHVSAAGGVENAVVNAAAIGANAFALFLKSQRKWTSPPLTSDSISEFKKRMKEYGYGNRMVLPHGSYLINLGNPDTEKREKSYECFVEDLKRCEELELELYNLHPGSTVGATTTENSLGLIAECINRAHKETKTVTVVLENMAGAGNIIGSAFSHMAGIIANVKDRSRVGVCLDTCHSFAAGYDIRTEEGWNATLADFDKQVGLTYLRGMHLNDSKTEYNSRKDRHENIGLGHLGLAAFQHIVNDTRTQNIPLILETPSFEQATEVWGKEIEVLQRLAGNVSCKDVEDPNDLSAFVEEIRSTVKEAELHGPKKAKKKVAKGTDSKGKGRKGELEDEEKSECEHGDS